MPKVVIQVAKCEPASVNAAGHKFGARIYDTAGTKYNPGPRLFGMFQEGAWYEIFYEDKSYQGNPFKQIMTASPTAPMATPPAAAVAPQRSGGNSFQAERSLEIWCNAMCQHAIDRDKLDPWNEEACCEFIEIQKRVFRRSFLGEEAPAVSRANGPAQAPKQAAYATGPAPGGDDMSDEIPF